MLYVVAFAGSILRAGTSELINDAVVSVLIPITCAELLDMLNLDYHKVSWPEIDENLQKVTDIQDEYVDNIDNQEEIPEKELRIQSDSDNLDKELIEEKQDEITAVKTNEEPVKKEYQPYNLNEKMLNPSKGHSSRFSMLMHSNHHKMKMMVLVTNLSDLVVLLSQQVQLDL